MQQQNSCFWLKAKEARLYNYKGTNFQLLLIFEECELVWEEMGWCLKSDGTIWEDQRFYKNALRKKKIPGTLCTALDLLALSNKPKLEVWVPHF